VPLQSTRTSSKRNAFAVGENKIRELEKKLLLMRENNLDVIAEVLGIIAGQVDCFLASEKETSSDSINVEWA